MRDGVKLATDIYRLHNAPPSQVLVARTPYNKNNSRFDLERFVNAGNDIVIQDVRGRYATDFTAKLVDVYPDGRAMLLTAGIRRVRYRNSLEKEELMVSGKIYEIEIDLPATSNVFLPGHRIGLEISSSNFPQFNRNSNTDGYIPNTDQWNDKSR